MAFSHQVWKKLWRRPPPGHTQRLLPPRQVPQLREAYVRRRVLGAEDLPAVQGQLQGFCAEVAELVPLPFALRRPRISNRTVLSAIVLELCSNCPPLHREPESKSTIVICMGKIFLFQIWTNQEILSMLIFFQKITYFDHQ